MSQPELRTRKQLVQDAVRRIITYTDQITWFGPNSTGRAIAEMVGGQVSSAYRLYRALIRRTTLLASSDDFTTQVAEEKGAIRLPAQQAKLLVVVQPATAVVTAITIGITDKIEVDDSTNFPAASSLRIRSADGSDTEIKTIIAVTTATGPNGNDEIEVSTLTNPYSPLTENVRVLRRFTIPEGSVLNSTAGVTFETVAPVSIGDANPVLDGEGTFLGLADKVWCEAQTAGEAGNIDAESIQDFVPPVAVVVRVFNPERGTGGADKETDFDLKFRASHGPTRAGQETSAWLEQTARDGEDDVLRSVKTTSLAIATFPIKVLHRNGGPVSVTKRAALELYIEDRVRSSLAVTVTTVILTSVEVSAQITLDPDSILRDVWKAAASSLAAHLDFRKWPFGVNVDDADLLTIVNTTPGVATLNVPTFSPTSNVNVAAESLPNLTKLTLEDTTTGDILSADLSVVF